jgi:hypothetical protein
MDAYHLAQTAIADLKSAVRQVLSEAPVSGLSNAQIGRALGIYAGHVGHEGHIPRTILGMLEEEGVAEQLPETKYWILRNVTSAQSAVE